MNISKLLLFVLSALCCNAILVLYRVQDPSADSGEHSVANDPQSAAREALTTIGIVDPKKKLTSKKKGRFVISFAGDTMVANNAYNWEFRHHGSHHRKIGDGFLNLKPLFNETDYLVVNLEGPLSLLPITVDTKPRSNFNYSFGMDPHVTDALKDLGVDAVNLANNHLADRGVEGFWETQKHLKEAGIEFFGAGFTPEKQAEPLMLDTPQGKVGITGIMEARYCCDELPNEEGERVHLTLRPEKADMAITMLKERGATIKIAFIHWINNYAKDIKDKTRGAAAKLADAGYDLIVGSAGSHTVKEFDYVNGKTPTFYDVGNFVFQKPSIKDGLRDMPWGTVTHLIIEDGKMKRLKIVCTLVNNAIVEFNPRECTPKEAEALFATLGPYLKYEKGNTFATVDLQSTSIA